MRTGVILAALVLLQSCAAKGSFKDAAFTAHRPSLPVQKNSSIEVTEGDSLWRIAEALWGDGSYWYSLALLNGIQKPWHVHKGKILKVPPKESLMREPLQGEARNPAAASAPKAAKPQTEAQKYGWIKKKNKAFTVGERLKFAVQYFNITGGFATLSIPSYTIQSGRPTFHIQAIAESHSSFDWIIRVRDIIDSFMDVDYLFSWKYSKHIREGSYRQDSDYIYDQREAHEVIDDNNLRTKIAPETQDVLSSFYYFRTLKLEPGDVVTIPVAADDMKFYELVVRVLHREKNVQTLAGTFDTIVVVPELKFNGVFQQKGEVRIWLTDDERHIPVKIRSKIIIGAINITLQEAQWVEPPADQY